MIGLEQIYQTRCLSKAMKITSDNMHPLYDEFELLPSGRRINRGQGSFLPQAVTFFNENAIFILFFCVLLLICCIDIICKTHVETH